MTDTPQLFEAGFVDEQMTVVLDPCGPAVSSAGPQGSAAGSAVVRSAVGKSTSAAVKSAGELLAIINAAKQKEDELNSRLVDIAKEETAAPTLLFGPTLTARLEELRSQASAVEYLRSTAAMEQHSAQQELRRLRDSVLAAAVPEVKKALQDRLNTVEVQHRKAAEKLAVTLAPLLAAVLKLDGEAEALKVAKASAEVKRALEKALPEVFSAGGLAPAEPPHNYRDSEEREEHIEEVLYGPPPPPRERPLTRWAYGVEKQERED